VQRVIRRERGEYLPGLQPQSSSGHGLVQVVRLPTRVQGFAIGSPSRKTTCALQEATEANRRNATPLRAKSFDNQTQLARAPADAGPEHQPAFKTLSLKIISQALFFWPVGTALLIEADHRRPRRLQHLL